MVEFETAGAVQDAGLAQQAGYTAAFGDLLSPGMAALKQLDVICRRRFRTNAVKLGAWTTASHIERQSSGSGPGGGGPVIPATPANVTFTQENPGDAVVGNADAVTGATIYRAYQRTAGSADEPVVVTSAAALPLVFTIPPGDYEFTMTSGTVVEESDPSAPVTLTVS